MLAAVVFDFDGIIIDSEPLHHLALREVLAGDGLPLTWEEYRAHYIGLDDRDAFRTAYRQIGRELDSKILQDLIGRKAEQFQRLISGGVTPYPGVVELIHALAGETAIALCSGALRCDIDPVLEHLCLTGIFPVIITADDVRTSKPDPESYRLVLDRLSPLVSSDRLPARQYLAIEDTPAGIASARGAGMSVLAVTNNFGPPQLAAASKVVSTLAGMTRHDLAEIVRCVCSGS